jgi:hypothetical protein
MEFGALMFFTEYAIPATKFARALEARGFESVWARPSICTSRPRANPSAKSDTVRRGVGSAGGVCALRLGIAVPQLFHSGPLSSRGPIGRKSIVNTSSSNPACQ